MRRRETTLVDRTGGTAAPRAPASGRLPQKGEAGDEWNPYSSHVP